MTFSILICALNEERNVGLLLGDIINSNFNSDFVLEKIIVVSDGSIDKTNEVAKKYSEKERRISLIINANRLGKAKSFNIGKKITESDFLISLDADVRLENKESLQNLLDSTVFEKVGLIGGNPVPFQGKNDTRNIAFLASLFSYNLVNRIKNQIKKGNNFFSAHGRILALSKKLYKKIEVPDLPGTDQFMYFSCLNDGLEFIYQKKAVVFYKLPNSIKDYLKQNIRFREAVYLMKDNFGEDFINDGVAASAAIKWKSLAITSARHPLQFLCWAVLFLAGRIKYQFFSGNNKNAGKWEISKTTK